MEAGEIRFGAGEGGIGGYSKLTYEGPKPKSKEDAWAVALAKWEFVVRWYDAHSEPLYCGAMNTCGLCMMYQSSFCDGCPVRCRTGRAGCENTPWGDYHYALDNMSASGLQVAAQAELEFLREVKEEEESHEQTT